MNNLRNKTLYVTDKINESNNHIYQEYDSIILALLNSKDKLKNLWITKVDIELINNKKIYSSFIHEIILNKDEYFNFKNINIYKKNKYLIEKINRQ